MSVIPLKADIGQRGWHVRLVPGKTWPSDDARYWGYKEAQLRPETPRNAISLQLLCVPLPVAGGSENLGWLSSLHRASPHTLGTISFLINSDALSSSVASIRAKHGAQPSGSGGLEL